MHNQKDITDRSRIAENILYIVAVSVNCFIYFSGFYRMHHWLHHSCDNCRHSISFGIWLQSVWFVFEYHCPPRQHGSHHRESGWPQFPGCHSKQVKPGQQQWTWDFFNAIGQRRLWTLVNLYMAFLLVISVCVSVLYFYNLRSLQG